MDMQNILRGGSETDICFGPMKLKELLNQHFTENRQVDFARSAGVAESTVSRWKNRDIPPTFENCLWIARGLNRDPFEIFEAAGHPEYAELYRTFLSAAARKSAPVLPASPCCENVPGHIRLHQYLERILHGDQRLAAFLAGNIVTFYSQVTGETLDLAATGLEGYEPPPGYSANRRARKRPPER